MIIDLIPIPDLAFNKVHYYSIRFKGKEHSEFRDFQLRMAIENVIELSEINRHIENIGRKYGAYPIHFRNEGAADGLPPPYHQFLESDDPDNYGLRLYCIRLSPSVVILLNGDRKTALKVQDCENCKPHFEKAVALSKKITKAIIDGNMEIDEDEKELLIDEDFELTL